MDAGLLKAYDDKDLAITEALYFDLRVFAARCDENGIAYQHFTDWNGFYDLPALEEQGFIRWLSHRMPRADGWRKYFPEQPYELTVKARVVLNQPGKYIIL